MKRRRKKRKKSTKKKRINKGRIKCWNKRWRVWGDQKNSRRLRKYHPSGKGSTNSQPATLHRLQSPRCPPGSPKWSTGCGKYLLFKGTFSAFQLLWIHVLKSCPKSQVHWERYIPPLLLAEGFQQISYHLAEGFRWISYHLAKGFQQISYHLAEGFRQINPSK